MTDRDRLIELFEAVEKDPAITCPHYKTDKTCDTCKYTINNFLCNHTERMVDYLLSNGVIVPPCKVGDTVYIPWTWEGQQGVAFVEVEEIKIYDNKNHIMFFIDLESDSEEFRQQYGGWKSDKSIGNTVFLTKEEAEKALAERSEDNAKM